jgi:hypothetical protein
MHTQSSPNSAIGREIDIRLTPRSLAPKVREALQVLGYTLRDEDDASGSNSGFWLVDESRLAEVPDRQTAPDARILLISSSRWNRKEDSRILAQTDRPAGLSAIYSMIQSSLEHTPRMTPRIRTQLSARCIKVDRRSIGAVLSLSEGGCLLRTAESLRKGTNVDLQFALPAYGLVSTPAQCRYVRKGNAGLEFSEPAPDVLHSIAHFVTARLAETLQNGGSEGACLA